MLFIILRENSNDVISFLLYVHFGKCLPHSLFYHVVKQFCRDCSVQMERCTQRKTFIDCVLAVNAHNLGVSIRSIFRSSKIFRTSVQRILKRRKFYPHKVFLHRELRGDQI